MPERFTETLRTASEASWSHAVEHRFVQELFTGAVADGVMARYLIQDHRFLDSFLVLLGAALASANTFEARLRLGRFIGMVSAEENTYFLRAFEALGVTEARRAADPDLRLRYFCSPYYQDSALFPFIDQLSRAAGFTRDDPPEARLEKLETVLISADPSDEDVALLVDLLSLQRPSSAKNSSIR
jgi:hypothetical protein